MIRIQSIDQVQRITGNSSYVPHPPPYIILQIAGATSFMKPIKTRVAVRQGGTSPRLGVAQVPLESCPSAEVSQLGEGPGELVY